MLKIQKSVKAEVVTFTLSGRIKAEELAGLQGLFEVEGQDHHIVLDLKEVKLVDRDAVKFLARCEANGTQLENCPAYIREWIMREPPRRQPVLSTH
jgi:anti-anti-sigma regulatory factor